MQDYLDWKSSTTKNPDTVKHYSRWVRRFTQFLKGEEITLEKVIEFKRHLQGSYTKKGDLYSPKNIQYGLQLVRDYISYQMTMHGLEFPLKLLKIPQERSRSHYAVTYDEYRVMSELLPLNEPQGLQRRLMLALLWDTGMRVGELARLKISDITGRSALIHNEKNHRSRTIGWSQRTEELIRFYLPLRGNLNAEEDWLFVSFKWRPCKKFTTRQIERIVEEIRKEAKIDNLVRPHSFRHGFVHRQLAGGRPITTISQMLGHSTTFNVMAYAQLNSKEIKEAWGI